MTASPCNCWTLAVVLHDGHCCFREYDLSTNATTCGHDEAGMRLLATHEATVAAERTATPSARIPRIYAGGE